MAHQHTWWATECFKGAMSLEQLEEAIDGAGNGVSPCAQRVGIIPDLMVRPTVQGIAPGPDEVLEVAVQYLETGEEGEEGRPGIESQR